MLGTCVGATKSDLPCQRLPPAPACLAFYLPMYLKSEPPQLAGATQREHRPFSFQNPQDKIAQGIECAYFCGVELTTLPANGGLWFVCHSKICAKIRLYSFGQCSVSFASYDYPRAPQTPPRYALQRYNKRYDHGYDLDTLGYDEKSTIATRAAARQCTCMYCASSGQMGPQYILKRSSRVYLVVL